MKKEKKEKKTSSLIWEVIVSRAVEQPIQQIRGWEQSHEKPDILCIKIQRLFLLKKKYDIYVFVFSQSYHLLHFEILFLLLLLSLSLFLLQVLLYKYVSLF